MQPILAGLIDYKGGREPETVKLTFVTNELDNLTKGELAGLHHKIVKITITEL